MSYDLRSEELMDISKIANGFIVQVYQPAIKSGYDDKWYAFRDWKEVIKFVEEFDYEGVGSLPETVGSEATDH